MTPRWDSEGITKLDDEADADSSTSGSPFATEGFFAGGFFAAVFFAVTAGDLLCSLLSGTDGALLWTSLSGTEDENRAFFFGGLLGSGTPEDSEAAAEVALGTTGALDLLGSATPAAGEALGTAAARALLGSGTPEDSVAAGEALGTTGVRDLLGSGTPEDSEAAAEVLGTAGTLAFSLGADLLLLGAGTVPLGTVATDVVTTVVSRPARDAIDSEPATLSRSAGYEGWSLSRTSGRSGTQTQCHEQGSDVPGGGPSGASGGGPSGGIGRRAESGGGSLASCSLVA